MTDTPGPAQPFDWRAWRRDVRRCLLSARRALGERDRAQRDEAIDRALHHGFAAVGGYPVAFYWPMVSEPEPRFAVRRWRDEGSRAALPVVVGPGQPLGFRQWWPGVAMAAGVYAIPYPSESAALVPSVLIVPVVGFDRTGYRLGYGGGYFDRTLAALEPTPLVIGLGYAVARMRTIHPQPHDVALDFVVTEAGIEATTAAGVEAVGAAEADRRVRRLLAERRLDASATR